MEIINKIVSGRLLYLDPSATTTDGKRALLPRDRLMHVSVHMQISETTRKEIKEDLMSGRAAVRGWVRTPESFLWHAEYNSYSIHSKAEVEFVTQSSVQPNL